MKPTVIYFIRHGHVENPRCLFYGRLLGFPLSDAGRRQAHYAMEFLRHETITAVYSSPQLRARETAQKISEPHQKIVLSMSELLNEVHCPYDGQPVEIVQQRNWNVYPDDTGNDKPDKKIAYETIEDVLGRAREFVAAVRLGHSGQKIVAVSHGDLMAFLILWAMEIACTAENKQKLYDKYVAPGSIAAFTFETFDEEELPCVTYINPGADQAAEIVFARS